MEHRKSNKDEYEDMSTTFIEEIEKALTKEYGKISEDIVDICKVMCYVMHREGYVVGYNHGGADAMNSIPNLNQFNR